MTSSLVAAAVFCVAVIVTLLRRIRRDAGGRHDTRYFQRVAAIYALGVIALMLAHVAGAHAGNPWVVVPSALAAYGAAYNLTLFAYSFPRAVEAPLRLRAPLLLFTALSIASTVRMSLDSGREPAWTLLYMLPHFALTARYVRRNWRGAEGDVGAPVTVVQLAILAPWVLVLVTYAALLVIGNARLPPWIDLVQCVVAAIVVVGGVGAAILRYHLFAVRVLVVEAVVGALVAALAGAYVAVAPTLHDALARAANGALASVVVGAVPVLMFVAALDVVAELVGRATSRSAHRAALERVLAATTSTVDPDAVLAKVLEAAREVTGAEVRFLRHGDAPSGEHRAAPPSLVAWLAEAPRRYYALEHAPELAPDLVAWMRAEGVGLVAPLRREGALHGALLVASPRPTRDETLTCAALAEHAALKFENHALYADALRLGRELEESRRLAALGSLAAAIAHDIRTPLTSIAMNVQIVRGSAQLSDGEREYLDIAREEVARLNDAVQEILDFSRPLQLRRQRVSPREAVDEVSRTLAPVLAERSVTLEVSHRAADASATLLADDRALRQLLMNLIENAADASPRGSVVRVETDFDGDALTLCVSDRGRGIAPENLERVFEPFFTTRPDGTGLGLAIAQKVVRGHGGEITVASEPERGTTFVVRLPREADGASMAG